MLQKSERPVALFLEDVLSISLHLLSHAAKTTATKEQPIKKALWKYNSACLCEKVECYTSLLHVKVQKQHYHLRGILTFIFKFHIKRRQVSSNAISRVFK